MFSGRAVVMCCYAFDASLVETIASVMVMLTSSMRANRVMPSFFALVLFVESDVVSRRAVVMRCFAFDVFSDRDDCFSDGHIAFLDARNIVRCKVRFPSDHARCEC